MHLYTFGHKLGKSESGERSLIVEVDEPGPELDLRRSAFVLEDYHVLQDHRTVPQLPCDARVVLKKSPSLFITIKWNDVCCADI